MTEQQMRDLLAAVAERGPQPSPKLAELAWRSAGQRRRRRQVTAVIGAAAVAAAVTVAVDRLAGDRAMQRAAAPAASGSSASSASPASPRPAVAARIQVAPAGPAEARLPWADTRLRAGLDLDVHRALPLSTAPAGRAAAVVQYSPSSPVLVLGADGRMRVIDGVRLEPNVDAGHNAAPILDSTSLSSDGTRVALLQPDEVVVVDLSSGKARRYRVPGADVGAVWHPDGSHVLISRDGTRSVLLDIGTGTFAPVAHHAGDAAFGDDGTTVELLAGSVDSGGPAKPATLRRYAPDGAVVLRRELTPMLAAWQGAPFLRSGVVARAGYTTRVDAPGLEVENPQAVAVIDARTGQLIRLLAIDYGNGHAAGCCPVLGWLDDDTVLIANLGTRILAWNTTTGEMTRVAELPVAAVALGDIRA